ncbi:MAG: glycosyltransferase family 1 protein [Eubacteriales bacterium]
MVRILHVVSNIGRNMGVLSVVMNYYQYIDKTKIQFDFLYYDESDDGYKVEIEENGGNIFKIQRPSIKNLFKSDIDCFFKENHDNIIAVHIHDVFLTFHIAPLARKYGIKNIITHAHAVKYSSDFLRGIRNYILCLPVNKLSDYKLACSEEAAIWLYGKTKLNSGKIMIINNAINCDKFRYTESKRLKIRNELNIGDEFVIGHIGRFQKEKNQSFLIDIFSEIKTIKPDAKLILIGDGPLFNEIKMKVLRSSFSEDVIFTGIRSDVNDLLSAMDFFVFPSLFESLGLAAIEAQCSGLPCFLSKGVSLKTNIIDCTYMDLQDSAKNWAEKIINTKKSLPRVYNNFLIECSCFNIKNEVKKLEDLYLSMSV